MAGSKRAGEKGLEALPKPRLTTQLRRLIHLRLIVPLLRGRHPPEYTARGVFYGVLIGLTPTVGVQMGIVFAFWLLLRSIRRDLDFNLIAAVAWTWISNALTLPPLYYVFFVTGQVLLGRWDDLAGYDAFAVKLAAALPADASWLDAIWVYTVNLFQNFGEPMFMGCIPWAAAGSWIAYKWSLGLVTRFQALRSRDARRRRQRRASRREAEAG